MVAVVVKVVVVMISGSNIIFHLYRIECFFHMSVYLDMVMTVCTETFMYTKEQ